VGRYDFVEAAFAKLGGEVRFHRVSVRPGHPILFGVIPGGGYPMHNELRDDFNHPKNQRAVAFFGLPGNPMACVACLRFFVIPYIRFLRNLLPESPTPCRVWSQKSLHGNGNLPLRSRELLSLPSHLTMFRLGVRSHNTEAGCVVLVPAQGSHKVQPLLHADCWVIFPGNRSKARGRAVLDTLPLHPTSFRIG
jgi:molybdopterin biosynthesis enzyme